MLKIVLEKNVNIGFNGEVFSGSKVVIGEDTIVGAGSVVTRDIPASSIVAGVLPELQKK